MTDLQPTLPSRAEHDRDKYSDHTAQLRHEELIAVLTRLADAQARGEESLCPHGYPIWCHSCEAYVKETAAGLR